MNPMELNSFFNESYILHYKTGMWNISNTNILKGNESKLNWQYVTGGNEDKGDIVSIPTVMKPQQKSAKSDKIGSKFHRFNDARVAVRTYINFETKIPCFSKYFFLKVSAAFLSNQDCSPTISYCCFFFLFYTLDLLFIE